MMLKLYKQVDGAFHYWEARWPYYYSLGPGRGQGRQSRLPASAPSLLGSCAYNEVHQAPFRWDASAMCSWSAATRRRFRLIIRVPAHPDLDSTANRLRSSVEVVPIGIIYFGRIQLNSHLRKGHRCQKTRFSCVLLHCHEHPTASNLAFYQGHYHQRPWPRAAIRTSLIVR